MTMAPGRDLHWPSLASLAFLATGLLSVGPGGILAQTSTAVCESTFNWMDNSLGQSPCTVSAYLLSVCNNYQYTVFPLAINTEYSGPNAGEENVCICNTVTYCTMSACAACQSRAYPGYDVWSHNCTGTTFSIGPSVLDIPAGTAVPQWADQSMQVVGDMFNITLAQSVGDNPESTGTAKPTSALATSTLASVSLTNSASASGGTDTSTPTNTSTPTGTLAPTSSSSSSNTAVIAGAVGGAVGLALVAAIVIFLRKKHSQTPPSAPAESPTGYTDSIPLFSQTARPKLYNPSDPSTFPPSVPPVTVMTESSIDGDNTAITRPTPSMHIGGHYIGMPEI